MVPANVSPFERYRFYFEIPAPSVSVVCSLLHLSPRIFWVFYLFARVGYSSWWHPPAAPFMLHFIFFLPFPPQLFGVDFWTSQLSLIPFFSSFFSALLPTFRLETQSSLAGCR